MASKKPATQKTPEPTIEDIILPAAVRVVDEQIAQEVKAIHESREARIQEAVRKAVEAMQGAQGAGESRIGGWEITTEKREGVTCICWNGHISSDPENDDYMCHVLGFVSWNRYAYHPALTEDMDGDPLPDHLRRSLHAAIRAAGLKVEGDQ